MNKQDVKRWCTDQVVDRDRSRGANASSLRSTIVGRPRRQITTYLARRTRHLASAVRFAAPPFASSSSPTIKSRDSQLSVRCTFHSERVVPHSPAVEAPTNVANIVSRATRMSREIVRDEASSRSQVIVRRALDRRFIATGFAIRSPYIFDTLYRTDIRLGAAENSDNHRHDRESRVRAYLSRRAIRSGPMSRVFEGLLLLLSSRGPFEPSARTKTTVAPSRSTFLHVTSRIRGHDRQIFLFPSYFMIRYREIKDARSAFIVKCATECTRFSSSWSGR